MNTQLALGIITAVEGVTVAAIGTVTAAHVRVRRRVRNLESRDRLWWLWTRKLLDHIYRGSPPPPPDAPYGLFPDHDTQEE